MNLGAILGQAKLGDTELGNIPEEEDLGGQTVLYPTADQNMMTINPVW